jgi:hypothetical protein
MYAGSGDVIQYSKGLLLTAAIFQDATFTDMVDVSSSVGSWFEFGSRLKDMFKSMQ